jgi:tetratricopeptide (TPR) repeat protein
MKKLNLASASMVVAVGLWLYATPRTIKNLETKTVVQSEEQIVPADSDPAPKDQEDVMAATVPGVPIQTAHSISTAFAARLLTPEEISQQNFESLISPRSTFDQKQAAWKSFDEPLQLDRLIFALGERLAINPQIPEYSAVLGQAYMKKCGQTQDIREQATFGMKADQLLENALSLDPSNWDARFTKAVGMSYWPAQFNKSQDVIQEFTTLIEQQEASPPEPHFARTYAWLGDQYRKAGQLDNAREVWQRGAALFPADADLKKKLAAQP